MRYAVLLVFSSLVICSAQSRENSAFANLKPGPHAVGFRVVQQYDYTRSFRAINIDVHGIDSPMRDIQFLASYAHTLPQADTAHIAAAGWSWGGMTNVFAAARDSRISALVSLDGTREPGFTKAIRQTEVTVPWLYISRRPQTIPELNKQGIESRQRSNCRGATSTIGAMS